MNKRRGFTLVEILLVAGIITAIGAVTWLAVSSMNKPRSEPINLVESNPEGQNLTALQKNQVNTQVKNDLSVAASAVAQYANDNSGSYPTSADQVEALLTDGAMIRQPFTSPITKKPYTAMLTAEVSPGVVSYMQGTCSPDNTAIEPAQGSRQYALATRLVGGDTYCVAP